MNKRNLYAVPDLPVKDIISYFSEMEIEVSNIEILKPSLQATQRIYDTILEMLEGPSQTHFDDSLQVIKQVQRMGNFLEKIGIQNFTIKDLMPDSKRFIQILSTIINFAMYRDNKRHVYEKVSQIADNNYLEKRQLEAQLSKVNEESQEMLKALNENNKIKVNYENEIQKLEAELKEFYKHQKDKISEVALLKAEKIEVGDKLCSCQLLEHNLKQEITCLKTQIVSDPTKLMELVGEMRVLIDKEKESIKSIERHIADQNQKLGKLQRIGEFLTVINSKVQEFNNVDFQIDKLDQSSILMDSKLKNWDSNINALKIRINHIDRQISHLESKIFNLQMKDKKCSEEISAKISNLKIKYDCVTGEREQMLGKVKSNNKLIQSLMYERAQIGGEHEKECSEIVSLIVQLSGQIDGYFSGLVEFFDE